MKRLGVFLAVSYFVWAGVALADETATSDDALHIDIVKYRASLRNDLSAQTGTSAYTLDQQAVEALPRGADTSFDKILQQTPGAAQDSYGQVHLRGEHADLQYRLNGILLPEGINGFGQVLDPHIMQSMTLLDGALPAQYGYRTAGVVDIQTKTGFENGGTAEMSAGSYGTLQPTISYGGRLDSADYFFSASHLSSDLGIENPTSSAKAIHDHTEQDKQFGYASTMINPMQRIEAIAGNSISHFQIPNNPGQEASYCVGSTCSFDSSQLNERQFESNQFGAIAWQGGNEGVTVQIAPYIRSSETHFRPDGVGDLVFNGVASDVQYKDLVLGLQNDNSWRVNDSHTLRAGFSFQNERIAVNNTSQVLPDATPTVPETIIDNSRKDGQLYGFYAQDEWKLTEALTLNYGARFDILNAYVSENQLSPRIGLVYKIDDRTTLHGGYARYFTPPPMELIGPSTVAAFANTSAAATITQDDPVKAERSHTFDIGATHQLTKEIKLGVDGYYKIVHDLLDLGQFGSALVYTPFNYEQGRIYGAEFTASYTVKTVSAYANFAWSRAMGKNVVSAQFNFDDPVELAYINNNYVHLDHDQTYTVSGGIDWRVLKGTSVSLNGIFGSGLRRGFANSEKLPWYTQLDFGVTQDLNLVPDHKTQLRFSVVNFLDTSYQLRDGSGIGVGAPQWGPRRGFYASVAQDF